MDHKELNVKVGDKVSVEGNKGIVTEVLKGFDTIWNGNKYEKVENSDYTSVRVHFTGDLANWGQYQDRVYGGYKVI